MEASSFNYLGVVFFMTLYFWILTHEMIPASAPTVTAVLGAWFLAGWLVPSRWKIVIVLGGFVGGTIFIYW